MFGGMSILLTHSEATLEENLVKIVLASYEKMVIL